MSAENENSLKKFEDLTYFDNLALYYLSSETPPETLALAFLKGDTKVTGSILGVMEPKRREYVHSLMAKENSSPEKKKESAVNGLLLIAENLISRGLIEKKGHYYFGVKKSMGVS